MYNYMHVRNELHRFLTVTTQDKKQIRYSRNGSKHDYTG
jgi:hypothetical protein